MSLDFQTVDIRFTEGLDTKTQPKMVLPSKWNKLENCTLSEDDTPTRRDGIAALVATANGNGLATYNKELLVVNGSAVSSVVTAGADSVVTLPGEYAFVDVEAEDVTFPGTDGGTQDSLDCATGAGLTCYVWMEPTNLAVRCTLVDEATGAHLQSNVLVNAAAPICPRVVFSVNAFYIFYIDAGGSPTLFCRVIQTSAPTVLGAQTAIIASASLPVMNFDAIDVDPGGSVGLTLLAYAWSDGTTSVRSVSVTQTAGVPSILVGPSNIFTEAQLPIATLTGLAVVAFDLFEAGVFATSIGAASMAGLAGRSTITGGVPSAAAVHLDANVAATATPCHVTGTKIGSRIRIFWDRQSEISVPGMNPLHWMEVTTGCAIAQPAQVLVLSASFRVNAAEASGPKGPWIFGKAFTSGGRTFLPTCIIETYASLGANTRTNNEQNVLLLLDGQTGVVVGKALPGSFGAVRVGITPTVSTPCSTPEVSSGSFALACTRRTVLDLFNGVVNTNTGVCRLTLTPNVTVSPIDAQLGGSTFLAGGALTSYTPGVLVEHGFPLFPEGISAVTLAGGGAMTAGTHQVVAIYEWYDNAGLRHQSAPSLAVATTQAANDRITVLVPTLLVSQKTAVQIVLYITQAGGLSFNRVAITPNDTTVAFVTIIVSSADTLTIANELLYTQPNQAGTTLANIAPGPSRSLAVHQNRVFFDKTDQPGQFGYSQQYDVINGVGLQFSPDLGGVVDVSGGAIVGFASMDEKLIIFCTNKPFVVYGAGPDSAGGGSGYGTPQGIQSDVGCTDPRSILEMPQGIIFKSSKGWYLLGRDLQVRYIGEGVAAFDADPVSSAVLLADRHECRFASSSGTQLIYSYDTNNGGQWSTTVYKADDGATISNVAVADAVWWPTGGFYATVSLVHGLNQDTPGVFLDQPGTSSAALSIPTTGRTAWLRMSLINGFQRIRWMYLTGTSPTAPTSTLTVNVDFDDAYDGKAPGSYQFTVPFATVFPVLTFVVGTSIDFRHKLIRQKCKSVAFTFRDEPTTANPAGVNFQALSLELGLKKGLKRLPAAQSV